MLELPFEALLLADVSDDHGQSDRMSVITYQRRRTDLSWKRRAIPAQQTILGCSALRCGQGAALSHDLDDALSVFWHDVVDDTHSNQCVGIGTGKHLRGLLIAYHAGSGGVIPGIMRHCFFSVMWHVR